MKDPLRAGNHSGGYAQGQVQIVKGEEPLAAQPGEVALLHASRVIVGEAIDAGDRVAVGQESFAEVGTDEPGRAGHHAIHDAGFLARAMSCGREVPDRISAKGRAATPFPTTKPSGLSGQKSSTTDIGIGFTRVQNGEHQSQGGCCPPLMWRRNAVSIEMRSCPTMLRLRRVNVTESSGRHMNLAGCATRVESFRSLQSTATIAALCNITIGEHLRPKSQPLMAVLFCPDWTKELQGLQIRQTRKKSCSKPAIPQALFAGFRGK